MNNQLSMVLPDETREPSLNYNEGQEIRKTLNQLSEDYWTVLVLRFLSGLSLEETSKVMKRSPGEVRLLQRQALSTLHNILEL